MSNRASTPFPVYNDKDGSPLDAGFIYFGPPNNNALATQIALYYDAELTKPAENPARTSNGYIVRNGAIRQLFCAEPIISIVVQNKRKETVWNAAYVNLNPGVTTDAVIDIATGDSQAEINADTLRKSQNLNDLSNKETARDNLSVYSKDQVDSKIVDASEAVKGIAEIATQAEVDAGTDDLKIVTPKKLDDYFKHRSIGFNQKYQDVTASRDIGTEYLNDTDSPIFVNIKIAGATSAETRNTTVELDGLEVVRTSNANEDAQTKTASFLWSPGEKYKITGDKSILTILEKRILP